MLLSVIVHIYNNQKALEDQARFWRDWDFDHDIELIFIDDGSSPPLTTEALPPMAKCYRVLEDIPWNMPGAKNLGAKYAQGEWLLFYDADQFLAADGIKQLISRLPSLKPNNLYRFRRYSIQNSEELCVHQNCQVIRKDEYIRIGGFDEDFSGSYGHDDSYFERVWTFNGGGIVILDEPFLLSIDDLATVNLSRDTEKNRLLRRKKMRYWHLQKSWLGRQAMKSEHILRFLIKSQLISDGRPREQIRFRWESNQR